MNNNDLPHDDYGQGFQDGLEYAKKYPERKKPKSSGCLPILLAVAVIAGGLPLWACVK